MIYFRTKEVFYKERDKEELCSCLNSRTTRAKYLFDSRRTSFYVLFKERQFIGKRINQEEIIISRYRHNLFYLFPRIVMKWKAEQTENGTKVVFKTRLGRASSIIFLFLSAGLFLSLVSSIIQGQILASALFPFSLFIYMIVSAVLEIRSTEKMMNNIILKKKIKSIFSV